MSQLGYLVSKALPEYTGPQQDSPLQLAIHHLVVTERAKQDAKWGARRTQPGSTWSLILGEEKGEVDRAVLVQDRDNLVEELVQAMAVASAWLEALALGNDGLSFEGATG